MSIFELPDQAAELPGILFMLLIVGIPAGLAAATYWARVRRRRRTPRVPPGEPGNPV